MSGKILEREREVEVAWTPSASRFIPSGAAVAAIISAVLGLITLAVVNLGAEASEAFAKWVHGIGKLWMPGAAGIGPYSGKETLSLVAWIGSWIVLHVALRNRELNLGRWVIVFLVGIGIATTLLWPPVYGYLAAH